jgi:multicomponent Na+:H+ antiporter subunit D
MNTLLLLPILIPMLTGIFALLTWRQRTLQRAISIMGTTGLLGASIVLLLVVREHGIICSRIGNWPAPFGIILVADLFSAIMVALSGIIGFTTAIYSLVEIDSERQAYGYNPLLNFLLMGVCGAFLTGDLFNLYVWFEIMLISSFVLMALGGEVPQMEGGVKYVTLNLISSVFFLSAVGLLYGLTGALNMADLSQRLATSPHQGLVTVAAMLFLVPFGIKAAIFPFYFWLPASYHTPPAAVSAIFAGLLTKVGVYALIRIFTLLFIHDTGYTHSIILWISALTMLSGVLGAVAQMEFRKVLSFHIISQIGYMVMGLGLFTRLALAGSVFYIMHHIIVKTNLFFVSGVSQRIVGSGHLKKSGGLYLRYPLLGVLFLIPALSLAGIPPLSGFFAKFALVKEGLIQREYPVVAISLFVSLLTLYSMTKIWNEAFWKRQPDRTAGMADPQHEGMPLLILPIVLLALLTLVIGLSAGWMMDLALATADQLLDPAGYVRAVLGGVQ